MRPIQKECFNLLPEQEFRLAELKLQLNEVPATYCKIILELQRQNFIKDNIIRNLLAV